MARLGLVLLASASGLIGCSTQQQQQQQQQQQMPPPPGGKSVQPAARAAQPATAPAPKVVAAPPATNNVAPPVPAAVNGARKHTIRPGDNLWNLAKQYYGDGTKYERIINANPGLNPDNMKPGTQIVIP